MANEGDSKKILQEALDELKEGQEAITERQRHIHFADLSEYHWQTVEVYKVGGLGNNDEDAKRIKEAERDVAQQINRDKKANQRQENPTTAPNVAAVGTRGAANASADVATTSATGSSSTARILQATRVLF